MTEAPSIHCGLCGLVYNAGSAGACRNCPLAGACALLCCPRCGYATPEPSLSPTLRLWQQIKQGFRNLGRAVKRRINAKPPAANAPVAGAPPPPQSLTLRRARPGTRVVVMPYQETSAAPGARSATQVTRHGILPGEELLVLQQWPATLVQIDHTVLALEPALAASVMVREAG